MPFKKTDLFRNICSLPSAIPGRYLVADEHETAGVCLTFLEENLGLGEGSLEATEELAASVPAREPGGDVHAVAQRGADAGRRRDHPGLVREPVAADDRARTSCARSTRASRSTPGGCSRPSSASSAGRLDPITLIGGGARSDLWCRIHADVLDRTILQAADPVLANVRGAALLAGVALGDRTVDEIDGAVEIVATHRPNAVPQPVYDAMYAEFLELYPKTKGIFRRLNRRRPT